MFFTEHDIKVLVLNSFPVLFQRAANLSNTGIYNHTFSDFSIFTKRIKERSLSDKDMLMELLT